MAKAYHGASATLFVLSPITAMTLSHGHLLTLVEPQQVDVQKWKNILKRIGLVVTAYTKFEAAKALRLVRSDRALSQLLGEKASLRAGPTPSTSS